MAPQVPKFKFLDTVAATAVAELAESPRTNGP